VSKEDRLTGTIESARIGDDRGFVTGGAGGSSAALSGHGRDSHGQRGKR